MVGWLDSVVEPLTLRRFPSIPLKQIQQKKFLKMCCLCGKGLNERERRTEAHIETFCLREYEIKTMCRKRNLGAAEHFNWQNSYDSRQ